MRRNLSLRLRCAGMGMFVVSFRCIGVRVERRAKILRLTFCFFCLPFFVAMSECRINV